MAVLSWQSSDKIHNFSTVTNQHLFLFGTFLSITQTCISWMMNVRWSTLHVRHHLKRWCISRKAWRAPLPVPEALACRMHLFRRTSAAREARLLRQQGRWTATLWASCVRNNLPKGADAGRNTVTVGFSPGSTGIHRGDILSCAAVMRLITRRGSRPAGQRKTSALSVSALWMRNEC